MIVGNKYAWVILPEFQRPSRSIVVKVQAYLIPRVSTVSATSRSIAVKDLHRHAARGLFQVSATFTVKCRESSIRTAQVRESDVSVTFTVNCRESLVDPSTPELPDGFSDLHGQLP